MKKFKYFEKNIEEKKLKSQKAFIILCLNNLSFNCFLKKW